jgi:hypothetical protein
MMGELIASNNPNSEWGKAVIEVTLKQWAYEKTFTLHVGGNCKGFDILEAAVDMIYDHILDTEDDASVVLTDGKGDTLLCSDEEDRGEYWIKKMVASVRIVDYIQPTLNEVRARNGAAPVPHGDVPYVPLGA